MDVTSLHDARHPVRDGGREGHLSDSDSASKQVRENQLDKSLALLNTPPFPITVRPLFGTNFFCPVRSAYADEQRFIRPGLSDAARKP